MPPIPGIRVVTASGWWTPKMELEQSMFVSAELVQIKNTFGKGPEYYCKYQATLSDGRKVLLPNRVSDISGVKWDISALMDWAAMQTPNRLLGEPVLKGVLKETGEPILVRGNWEKLDGLIKKCSEYQVTLDDSDAMIQAWEEFSSLKLLEFHRRSFYERNEKRDEAAELGTRAHDLIDKWLGNLKLQDFNENGTPLFDRVKFRDRDGQMWVLKVSDEDPKVQGAIRAFYQLFLEKCPVMIGSELLVVDLANGVAGMIDNVSLAPDGARIIVDYKTGGYIGQGMLIQTTGYACMYELCFGQPIDRVYIAQLDKLTGKFRMIPVFETAEEKAKQLTAWYHAVDLYHWQKAEGKRLDALRKKEDAA